MGKGKFTVDDKIVSDSLNAIHLYEDQSNRYKLAINGGIATQLYTFPHFADLIRPTHDVDLMANPRLTSETFRENAGRILAEYLQTYTPSVNVSRHVYEVKLEDLEKLPFFIHSYRWTENGFDKNRKDIERQVSNANQVEIPDSNNSVYVVRPEDLISGKVDRLEKIRKNVGFKEDSDSVYQKIKGRDWNGLEGQDFAQWLDSLIRHKATLPAYFDRGKDEFKKALDEYVSSKDLYDISLIAKLVSSGNLEFDEAYYDRILQGRE